MKQTFIASSRKFFPEIKQIIQQLKCNGIIGLTPMTDTMDVSAEGEKNALLCAFKIIDSVDEVYVFTKNGYIGKTVAMGLAYAYAKNKKIISSKEIDEPSLQAIITKVMDSESYIKSVVY